MNPINLDGRVFVPVANSDQGTVSDETLFYFSQNGTQISARYHGGAVKEGRILGHFLQVDQADLL